MMPEFLCSPVGRLKYQGAWGVFDKLQGGYVDNLTYLDLLKQLELCTETEKNSLHLVMFLYTVHCKRNWNISLLPYSQLNQI